MKKIIFLNKRNEMMKVIKQGKTPNSINEIKFEKKEKKRIQKNKCKFHLSIIKEQEKPVQQRIGSCFEQ